MLETSTRVLHLLALLQQQRQRPGSELATLLGVSARTVRNDVDRLRELGYPVEAGRGRIGGYRLAPGSELPPLLLDDDEAVAVAIGLRQASSNLVSGIEESSARALTKLEQVLPKRLAGQVNGLVEAMAPQSASAGPRVDAATLTAIASAARECHWLRFEYAPFNGEPAPRRVEPYRLVNWGRRWYLVAWDLERADWRSFRVDRMTLRPPTLRRFEPRPLPAADVSGFVLRGVASAGWRFRARVEIHAPAEVVIDKINPAVGLVEPIDGSRCVLVTGAEDVMTVAVYLAMLDEDFIVRDSPELVAAVRRIAVRYANATPQLP